ncbi:transport permease protein [Longimycelium tulufanense]|uniref:Transport permease protein n=1 Tax=Longimycelium tulufanense TaxID=907463 RepID=A0A8J3CEM3_9PSEU|nr:ABC transporter permease [Longimycelium tulufanense]GGM83688.1 transport permease protein [Longimycelium tulufanense]
MSSVDSPARSVRLGRFEIAAVLALWRREWILFRREWSSITFSATIEPIIYLLAFGFGFGSLVAFTHGYRYLDFVGTGVVATAVLFASIFPAMLDTFVRSRYQNLYDTLLGTPIDARELVTAQGSWIGLRAGVYGTAPILVAMAFGLPPSWGMLLVPVIGFVMGFGFALLGIWVGMSVPSMNTIEYVISGLVTPLFVFAGTFFPLDGLPGWTQTIARINPLYHCVELVRHSVFGFDPGKDALHLGVLLIFTVVCWLLATRKVARKLVT